MHHFFGESRCRVTNQRDMVPKLHRIATGRLDAGVGQQPDNDDVTDAVLLQLLIEIRVREPALSPVLRDDDIAVLRGKIRMPLSAPFASRETMAAHDSNLGRVGMTPGFIVSWLPAAKGHDENLHAGMARRVTDGFQVIEKLYLARDVLDARPDFSAFRKEIIIGLDEQERCRCLAVRLACYGISSFVRRSSPSLRRAAYDSTASTAYAMIGIAGIGEPHARGLETVDKAGEGVRSRAARKHRLNQAEAPTDGVGLGERADQLCARGCAPAPSAERFGQPREAPVVQIVEARFRLEDAQHLPAGVIKDAHNRVPAVAAAVTKLEPGHLERAVADEDQRPLACRDRHAEA